MPCAGLFVALPLLAAACDRPKARAESATEAPAASAKPTASVKSCMMKEDRVCNEYERPELASKECGAGGEVLQGPCPSDGRVGSCTTLVSSGGAAYTVERVHYAGGRADPEGQCKLASGTWKR